jgi:ribosomal protein S18 acetylase RimI-like enzyme
VAGVATEMRLRDGTRAITWALLPEDRDELARGYDALGPDSKFHRFLTGVPHLSEAMLRHLVDEVDGDHHLALVLFLLDEEGNGTPAGVGHLIRYKDDPTTADVAVTVTEDSRGRGVASALLARLVAERPADVDRLLTTVAADNGAALAMLQRLGPTTVVDHGDSFEIGVRLGPVVAEEG